MAIVWFVMVGFAYAAEAGGNPIVHALGVSGGNMEGKETRFGVAASALFAVVTTVTSCGAVNAMHDSFMPLGGLVPLADIQLGEVIFGGVGSGLYGMLGLRRAHGLHRRPHGRPHAGISRQEDRTARNAARDA